MQMIHNNEPRCGSTANLRRTSVAAMALCVSAALLIPSVASAQDNVVSYRGSSASANDIIKSFMGGSNKTAKKRAAKQPKFRGIRFTDPTPETQQQQEAPPPAQTEQAAKPPAQQPAAVQASAQPQQAPAPQQAAPAQPAPQTVASAGGCPASGTAVALEIKFAVNSAVLEADAYRNLRQMSQAINSEELRGCSFAVEGHTDASGNPNHNLKLSRLRAASVKNFLMSTEIPTARLKTVGKGSRSPLDQRNPYAPENRRVQFRILGPSGG